MDDGIVIGDMKVKEYNGKFELVSVRHYDGKTYENWGRMELGKDKRLSEKSQPFKINLGEPGVAAERCLDTVLEITKEEVESVILNWLKGKTGNKYSVIKPDVPF